MIGGTEREKEKRENHTLTAMGE